MTEATTHTKLLDALEEIRAGLGLESLSVWIQVHPEDYPEAAGAEAADLICRAIGQHLGIGEPLHKHLPKGCREALASLSDGSVKRKVSVFYYPCRGGEARGDA